MSESAATIRLMISLLVCAFVASWALPLSAGEKADDAQIRKLIRELNSDKFGTREAATAQLMKIGESALPRLEKALKHRSAEVRSRASRVIEHTLYGETRRQLVKLASAAKDKDVDLERGMWLISRVVGPRVKQEALDRQLDDLAERVRKHLRKQHGKNVDPAKLSPEKAVAALRQVLFTELGFNGNVDDYDNPINSSLYHVLKTRKGLPILLSHVVVAVGRRLKMPIVGLGIAGRYMCKYDGSRAPGQPAADIVINPFEAGKIMTAADLTRWLGRFNPREDLAPDGNRSAISRMLLNLANDYEAVGDPGMTRRVSRYRELFVERI